MESIIPDLQAQTEPIALRIKNIRYILSKVEMTEKDRQNFNEKLAFMSDLNSELIDEYLNMKIETNKL